MLHDFEPRGALKKLAMHLTDGQPGCAVVSLRNMSLQIHWLVDHEICSMMLPVWCNGCFAQVVAAIDTDCEPVWKCWKMSASQYVSI